MNISGLLLCGLFLIVVLFISTSVALSALLSPIQNLGRSNLAARAALILILGWLACSISFGTSTRLGAEIQFAFLTLRAYPEHEYTPAMQAATAEEQRNKNAIVNELWIREIMPPPVRRTCYTDNSFACDFVSNNKVSFTWSAYLQSIGPGIISAVICAGLVWRFTRQK